MATQVRTNTSVETEASSGDIESSITSSAQIERSASEDQRSAPYDQRSVNGERPQLVVLPGGIGQGNGEQSSVPVGSPAEVPAGSLGVSVGGIRIHLDFFQGPMDLFLHLVQQQEVDIAHVSMKLVAEQYLAVVSELMAQLESDPSGFMRYDLEQVSEYLVIAATLTAIKSAAVLPNGSTEGLEENLEPADQAFLEELRERLRVYEQTKKRAEELNRLPQLGVDTFQRIDRKALLPTPEMLAEPDDPLSLGEHLSRLLKRIGALGSVFKIRLESVSIVNTMMRMIDVLNSERRSTFQSMVKVFGRAKSGSKAMPTGKTLVIGSFLAVLELMKRGVLVASQREDGADIEIVLRGNEELATGATGGASIAVDELVSEFDEEEVNGVS